MILVVELANYTPIVKRSDLGALDLELGETYQ